MMNRSILLLILVMTTSFAWGQSKFDGLFGGVEIGSQTMFSGALIDDVDVLKHQNRLATVFSIGYRKQVIKQRMVIGMALQFGIIDGTLGQQYNNGSQQIAIDYSASSQNGFSLQLGAVLGTSKDWMLGGYLNEVNRDFNIIWTEQNGTEHQQEDGNSFARYGLIVEKSFLEHLNGYMTIGQLDVDFEGANTTEDVTDKVEVAFGVNFQF